MYNDWFELFMNVNHNRTFMLGEITTGSSASVPRDSCEMKKNNVLWSGYFIKHSMVA